MASVNACGPGTEINARAGPTVAGNAADGSGRHFVRSARLPRVRSGGQPLLRQFDRDVECRHVRCPNGDQQVVGRGVRHGEAHVPGEVQVDVRSHGDERRLDALSRPDELADLHQPDGVGVGARPRRHPRVAHRATALAATSAPMASDVPELCPIRSSSSVAVTRSTPSPSAEETSGVRARTHPAPRTGARRPTGALSGRRTWPGRGSPARGVHRHVPRPGIRQVRHRRPASGRRRGRPTESR